MCIFTIIRTINVPTVNSKKFLLRVDILMSSLALFFLTSLAIFGKIERFSSPLSRFPTKKFEIFTSQTEAHPGFGKVGGHNRECGGEAGKEGRFSHKKTLILAHFFNEKGHAVSAVTRDNSKIFSQLTVCLKAEAWPK